MAILTFKHKGKIFAVRDIGNADAERLVFSPAKDAASLERDYKKFEADTQKKFEIDGTYWPTIDPTDGWSRRRDFVEHIGAEILKYEPQTYPENAIF